MVVVLIVCVLFMWVKSGRKDFRCGIAAGPVEFVCCQKRTSMCACVCMFYSTFMAVWYGMVLLRGALVSLARYFAIRVHARINLADVFARVRARTPSESSHLCAQAQTHTHTSLQAHTLKRAHDCVCYALAFVCAYIGRRHEYTRHGTYNYI